MKRVKSYRDLVTIKEGKEYLKCTKCNTEKELTEENFYKKGKTSEDWICVCKECKKGYYQENREYKQEYQLKYAEENKDYYHEYLKQYNQGGKGAVTISMKDFRQGIIPEVNYKPTIEKLIHIDGEVDINNKKFTRIVGGFNKNSIIITDKQIADILGYSRGARQTRKVINDNIKHFEDIHIKDLRKIKGGLDESTLKDIGYSKQSITQSENIYVLSESGFLLYLKFAEGDKAVEIYKNFIEDYFKTKVELAVAEKTIQENSDVLLDTKKMLLGSAFLETDEKKKFDMFMQIEDINRQLIDNARTLAKEETIEQFRDVIEIADRFTNGSDCFDIGLFSKLLDIPRMGRNNMMEWMRKQKMLQENNAPYQNMMDYFKVVKVESKNGFICNKTLLKSKGIKFVVNRLISKGIIDNLTTAEVLEKLKDMQAA